MKNNKQEWFYIEDIGESECLDCKHKSRTHAECNEFVFDNETGENEVFCPKCKSSNYYAI